MKQIAIVEDETPAAQTLTEYIARYAAETGQEFEVTRSESGEKFLREYRPIYAVVFLDIQMPGRDGMETAAASIRSSRLTGV